MTTLALERASVRKTACRSRAGSQLALSELQGPTASDSLTRVIKILDDAKSLREMGGVRFSVTIDGVPRDAFAVRWRGKVYAYVNSCRHQGLCLDFGDAHFFDEEANALVCCHHGARYRPDTGECFEGPCVGGKLTRIEVAEKGPGLFARV